MNMRKTKKAIYIDYIINPFDQLEPNIRTQLENTIKEQQQEIIKLKKKLSGLGFVIRKYQREIKALKEKHEM